jgi:hypothetical protein
MALSGASHRKQIPSSTRLDAAIQNKYSRDPDKLAAWKSASRTERPAKKAAAVTPPPAA